MGLKHRDHETWGVQFHPESILTEGGKRLLANFLSVCAQAGAAGPAGGAA
jgi:anthranilate/para-aminobenzoate synthase component II